MKAAACLDNQAPRARPAVPENPESQAPQETPEILVNHRSRHVKQRHLRHANPARKERPVLPGLPVHLAIPAKQEPQAEQEPTLRPAHLDLEDRLALLESLDLRDHPENQEFQLALKRSRPESPEILATLVYFIRLCNK